VKDLCIAHFVSGFRQKLDVLLISNWELVTRAVHGIVRRIKEKLIIL
jgi:hypothetical protein